MFNSFFLGGFECSCQITYKRERLDLIASTNHDIFVDLDYLRLKNIGVMTIRDGVRWHLVEEKPEIYDFSSVLPMIQAAQRTGLQVIWDLCHYGWPNNIDLFKPEFIKRFKNYVRNFVLLLQNESDQTPCLNLINEVSYLSWACAQTGYMYPFVTGRGVEAKIQFVRALIEATEEVWSICPEARIVNTDPAIHIVPSINIENTPIDKYNKIQYQARDILIGLEMPWIGGNIKYLDIVGVNYYPFNQWISGKNFGYADEIIEVSSPLYRPLNSILKDIDIRYNRPLLISETGVENTIRPSWLNYVMSEINTAKQNNVDIMGLCWYPILDYPGWDDNRHCECGLWGYTDRMGNREIYGPLVSELKRHKLIA